MRWRRASRHRVARHQNAMAREHLSHTQSSWPGKRPCPLIASGSHSRQRDPMKFSELGLSEKVLNAVEASGYDTPTPIQAQAIPHALEGRDVLGIAQTGTGKTAAFTLPMLSMLERGRARARMPRTLILEPTRELAAQVEEAFGKYGINHKLNLALLIGGVSFGDQEAKIARGADVVIATPGRLLDFTERGGLLLTGIEILVIDEADRMLDMGFIPDIERICKLVPFTRQTLFFSATMPPEITRLVDTFLHNPVRVEVARAATTNEGTVQTLVPSGATPEQKRATLRRPDPQCGQLQKRDHLLQPQARRAGRLPFPGEARVFGRRAARRPRPARADGRAGRVSRRSAATARLLRRRRARPRHSRRQPCDQLRRAPSLRGLRPSDRPHRPRGQDRGERGPSSPEPTQKSIAEIEKLIARKIEWREGAEMPSDDKRGAVTRAAPVGHRGEGREKGEEAIARPARAACEATRRAPPPDRHPRVSSRRVAPPSCRAPGGRERVAAEHEHVCHRLAPPGSTDPSPAPERPFPP